jgi:hypothetical protein
VGFVNPFGGEISDDQVADWLSQFAEAERPAVSSLLEHFHYYSFRRFADLVGTLPGLIARRLGMDPGEVLYAPTGYVSDSGSMVLYLFRHVNDVPYGMFASLEDLGNKAADAKAVVLLDDFIGTGRQAAETWLERIKPLNLKCPVVLAAVVGVNSGIQWLEANTDLMVVAADRLDSIRPLDPDAGLYSEPERESLLAILTKYGDRLYPSGPTGFAGAQSLVAFYYSTPNNTFPIFWSTSDRWKPLLPHRPGHLLQVDAVAKDGLQPDGEALTETEEVENETLELPEIVTSRLLAEFHTLPAMLQVAPAFSRLGIDTAGADGLLGLVRNLIQARHEQAPVCGAVLVVSDSSSDSAARQTVIAVEDGLTLTDHAKAEAIAALIDGLSGALMVNPSGVVIGSHAYSPRSAVGESLPQRYAKAAWASRGGLLFVFLGSGRAHVFADGKRVLTHRSEKWHAVSFPGVTAQLQKLSAKHGIPESTLSDVMRLAYLISDRQKGALMTVGDHDAVMKISEASTADGYSVRAVRMSDSPDEGLVGLMSQDMATIIASDGTLVLGRATLRPPAGTEVVMETNLGTKHKTAAQVSAITNALTLAVSVDGGISIYDSGRAVLRTII